MTRTVFLFDDGTALVDGIEADALGEAPDLPFLSEAARVSAARAALAKDDWDAAEAVSRRGVVSATDGDQVRVTFVEPPRWDQFGDALWQTETGAAHAVFHTATMLVGGVAVTDCVGLPFEDEAARRDCAAWCLRNGLDDIALRVSRTPVGGEGPHCTWPEGDVDFVVHQAEPEAVVSSSETDDPPEDADAHETRAEGPYGTVVCPLDL